MSCHLVVPQARPTLSDSAMGVLKDKRWKRPQDGLATRMRCEWTDFDTQSFAVQTWCLSNPARLKLYSLDRIASSWLQCRTCRTRFAILGSRTSSGPFLVYSPFQILRTFCALRQVCPEKDPDQACSRTWTMPDCGPSSTLPCLKSL